MSEVVFTNEATPATPAAGLLKAFATSANKGFGTIDENGFTLTNPAIRQNEIQAVRPQVGTLTSASPVGNVSTVEKMMGLAGAITPQVTGRILVIIAGVALNSTAAGDGTTITAKYGTGTAPINGAASAGTTIGLAQHFLASTTAGQQGFVCMGVVTGLTLGTALWLDLALLAVTAGGSTVKDVSIVAIEL